MKTKERSYIEESGKMISCGSCEASQTGAPQTWRIVPIWYDYEITQELNLSGV